MRDTEEFGFLICKFCKSMQVNSSHYKSHWKTAKVIVSQFIKSHAKVIKRSMLVVCKSVKVIESQFKSLQDSESRCNSMQFSKSCESSKKSVQS